MAKEKKKKSIVKRIFRWFFGIIFSFILLIIGFSLYLYFAKGINVINTIKELIVLNQEVNLTEISKNPWNEDDLLSAKDKIDNVSSSDLVLKLTDCEIGAYINDKVLNSEDKIKVNIGGVNVNLVDYGFEIIEMTFDLPEDPSEIWTNFKLITKIDTTKIKSEQFATFPKNLIAKLIPDTLYISSNVEIDKGEEQDDYKVKSQSFLLNNLDNAQTRDLFKTINTFIGIGDADAFNKNFSSSFVDVLLGNHGIYECLKESGATGYSFSKEGEENLFVVYMVDTSIEYTITYENIKSAENVNKTTYKVNDSKIVLSDLEKEGYSFNGFYTQPNGEGSKVTQIDPLRMENVVVYADWDLIEYTISYDLKGGSTTTPNRTSYTIETETFTLINPTKVVDEVDCAFLGWTGTDLIGTEISVTIPQGSTGDRSYKARYENDGSEIKVEVEGIVVKTFELSLGEKINRANLENLLMQSDVGLSGYSFEWFDNQTMTNPLDFNSKIYSDKTIFAKSSYITNNISFYPYITEFQNAVSNQSLQIESFQKLKSYVDFVRFYDIKTNVKLLGFNYLTFLPNNSSANINMNMNKIQEEINKAYNEVVSSECFKTSSTLSFPAGFDGVKYYGGCYISLSNWDTNATRVLDAEKTKVYEQQDYALRLQYSSSRSNSFDNFNINNVSKNISVSTSEQLVWVLENGYRPLPTVGSNAEDMYNKAKAVLREIVDSNMRSIQKLKAIYEWLVLNVQYDNDALDKTTGTSENPDPVLTSAQAKEYDSWYLEGVFNNKKAVCEGFAKALLVMSRIEGIPAVFVTGNNHAWNKVYIDENWYAVDATHGNVEVSNPGKFEIVSYRTFMFKDSLRLGEFETTDYLDFAATTDYNFYGNEIFTYNSNNYDLIIESQAELVALFNSVKIFESTLDCDYYTVEFVIGNSNAIYSDSWILTAVGITGLNYSTRYNSQIDSIGNHIYNIVVRK